MTYKETLFFIAKCLTINSEKHNRILVEKNLQCKEINWEAVVKVSTTHYVLPALYYNLKSCAFLKYLPNDLIMYMEHITKLNKDRNKSLIAEAKEINSLLVKNNITPIFIKGIGNLLEELYENISERMLGDIDIIVAKKEYNKTIAILKENEYKKEVEDLNPSHRHYPRLVAKNKIGCIEVHSEFLRSQYKRVFNYNLIKKNIQFINGYHVLGYEDQLILSTLSHQINNYGFDFVSFSLRVSYDLFLISNKYTFKNIIHLNRKIQYPINCYLSLTSKIFNNMNSTIASFDKTYNSYIDLYFKYLEDAKEKEKHENKIKRKNKRLYRFNQLVTFINNNEYRKWSLNKVLKKK